MVLPGCCKLFTVYFRPKILLTTDFPPDGTLLTTDKWPIFVLPTDVWQGLKFYLYDEHSMNAGCQVFKVSLA